MRASNKKRKSKWGGPREGAGRRGRRFEGGTEKICISVSKQNWHAALEHWKGAKSQLVDGLIARYIVTGGSILQTEAV
jgi:hypothetical protein